MLELGIILIFPPQKINPTQIEGLLTTIIGRYITCTAHFCILLELDSIQYSGLLHMRWVNQVVPLLLPVSDICLHANLNCNCIYYGHYPALCPPQVLQ